MCFVQQAFSIALLDWPYLFRRQQQQGLGNLVLPLTCYLLAVMLIVLMQVVEAAARRALAAERAQQHGIQAARQAPPRPVLDDSSPSTSGSACFFCRFTSLAAALQQVFKQSLACLLLRHLLAWFHQTCMICLTGCTTSHAPCLMTWICAMRHMLAVRCAVSQGGCGNMSVQ